MIHLQQFNPEDMFAVLKLASKVLTEQYNPTLFSFFYEVCPWGFWTAHQYQQVIGFIVGLQFTTDFAKILMIGVEPSKQQQGIGSHLLNKLLEEFRKKQISSIELEVAVNNTRAINFYKKHKFVIVDEFSQFYQNGGSAYIMRWLGSH